MNKAGIKQIIITIVSLISVIVVAAAFTVAWYQEEVVDPYQFDITADGVLFVYIGTTSFDSEQSFAPAVAMSEAIEGGQYYDVTKVYNSGDANPSYISKAATVATINTPAITVMYGGAMGEVPNISLSTFDYIGTYISYNGDLVQVTNENRDGMGIRPGETLAYNSGNMQTAHEVNITYSTNDYIGLYVYYNDTYTFVTRALKDSLDIVPGTTKAYKDNAGEQEAIFINGVEDYIGYYIYVTQNGSSEYIQLTEDNYTQYTVIVGETKLYQPANEMTVNVDIRFKGSNTSNSDYFDSGSFTITNLHMYSNASRTNEYDITRENENKKAHFVTNGTVDIYVDFDVYLTYPDELLDPEIRGKDIYIEIAVSVEVGRL